MDKIGKFLVFVNEQQHFHEKRAESFSDNPYRGKKHAETAEMFSELREWIQESELGCNNQSDSTHALPKQFRLSLTPDDVEGLPDELLAEINISANDKIDYAIEQLLIEAGGMLSLDQLLVGLYKKTGEVSKRAALTNRLFKLAKRGVLFSVPGKKGIYALSSLSGEEIDEKLQQAGYS